MLFLCGCDDKQMSFRSVQFYVGQKPDIVVRVMSQDGAIESFVLSNEAGLGFMPLRLGNYCLETYDKKGQALSLDVKQHSNLKKDQAGNLQACFEVEKNQFGLIEIGARFTGIDETKRIPLGFAYFVAEKAESVNLSIEKSRPNVIVRVVSQDGKGESFALSDRPGLGKGIGVIPFRPGNYCFETYGYKNEFGEKINALRLEVETPTCFSVLENETTNVEVKILGIP